LDSDEKVIRNGASYCDPTKSKDVSDISVLLQDNVVYESMLVKAVTEVMRVADDKGSLGVVLPKHTGFLLHSCQYIFANQNKSWLDKTLVAARVKDWWNGPNSSM
jgi:hypothetical protein